MLQLFLRKRAGRLFNAREKRSDFKARSPERDAETDRLRAASIMHSIEAALSAAEAEHAGLSYRVEDVLARASVTFGNAADEYLTRDERDSRHQDLFGVEILNGQRRTKELLHTIAHFRFLRGALITRFPNIKTTGTIK